LFAINFLSGLIVLQKVCLVNIFFVPQKEFMKNPKIGRPKLPKGDAKSCMIRARVTPSEQQAIERAANGMGVSEWARKILMQAVGQ